MKQRQFSTIFQYCTFKHCNSLEKLLEKFLQKDITLNLHIGFQKNLPEVLNI